MNSLERVHAVIRGGIPDKVPIALHNSLLAAKMARIPMSQAFQDGGLIETKCREAIAIVGVGGGFIMGPGCALSEDTPLENVDALIAGRDKYGIYGPDESTKK